MATIGRLTGKRLVVTGAASGIGEATALRFAEEGATVLAVDLAAPDLGSGILGQACDVTDADQCAAMAGAARQRLGGCDGFFANAGITGPGSVLDIPIETWHRIIAVNLTGVFLTNRALLPLLMEAGGGSVVNTSSLTAMEGVQQIAAYAASKGGVAALTRAMAADHAEQGIRVNAIAPGTVPTPLVFSTYQERAPDRRLAQTAYDEMLVGLALRNPLRTLGTVADIASLVTFLLSDESAWITGQVFVIAGGADAIRYSGPG